MQKPDIDKLLKSMETQSATMLQGKASDMQRIIDERQTTKNMYFWHPSSVASGRRYNEQLRNIQIDVALTDDFEIQYTRQYSESCHYVYASDWITDAHGNKLTIRDLKKLIEGISKILEDDTSWINE